MEHARPGPAERRPAGLRVAGGRRGRVDGVEGRPPPHHRPGDGHRPATVGPSARHLGRHHLLGHGGLSGLCGRPVWDDRAAGHVGRSAVVAGRGCRREPARPVRARVRRRGGRPQPVHGAAGDDRRVLCARAQHAADPGQPVLLAGLATGRRPLGHRARRGCGDLLSLSSGPAHRPDNVPGRAHRGGPGRPGPARGPGRDMAAPPRRGHHRGRPAGGRDRRRAGRHRQAGRARHDRHPGPARCGERPAGPLHPGLQPHANPGLPEPRLCRVPAGHGGRPRAGAHRGGRPARRAGPDQPGRGDLPAGTGQLGRRRPGRPVHHRPPAGVPPAPARPAARAGHDHQCAGRRAAGKRRARHRGRRHRRRPRRIAGAAGGHGGADHGGQRPANGPPPGIPPGNGFGMSPPGPAPGSPAYAAARRFAALPASTRHTWLVRHLAGLRAGRITLAQLP